MTDFTFPPTSRYFGIEIATLAVAPESSADGQASRIPYLRRRLLPASDRFALLHEHLVTEGERMDLIAARELGDSEAFWRICDANDAMRPEDLAITGRRLRITLPLGVPGSAD
jgi:hypothetical protein